MTPQKPILLKNQLTSDYILDRNCVNSVLGMHSRHVYWVQRITEFASRFACLSIWFGYCAKFQETLKYLRNINLWMNLSGVNQLSFGDYFGGRNIILFTFYKQPST